ncbi:MAG: lysylphosphatidylglycerol synthase transmembrane domain-containing protein, partial [Chloroflexota bacterium]|nr:lysylphosphatidylglycerol synthase transmembrane domain-containing protein [Chloroflexota bacterium]
MGTLFLFLALRNIRLPDLLGALTQANALFLIAALGSVVATSLAKAIRWKLLFYPRHHGLHLDRLFSVIFIGQTVNSVLPARLGEIARAYLVGELEKVSKSWTLGTIIVEKALDSMMLLLVMAALVPFVPLPAWIRTSGLTLVIILALLFLFLVL